MNIRWRQSYMHVRHKCAGAGIGRNVEICRGVRPREIDVCGMRPVTHTQYPAAAVLIGRIAHGSVCPKIDIGEVEMLAFAKARDNSAEVEGMIELQGPESAEVELRVCG